MPWSRSPSPVGDAAIRPSSIRTTRSAAAATAASCVTSRMVWPPCVQPAEQLDHLLPAVGVQRAGGLVGEHQRRLVRQRPGDGQPLALAA